MKRLLERITAAGESRPRLTLLCFGGLAVLCAIVALGLQPSANVDTLVSSGSADYRATQTDDRQFGGAAVDVLVRQPLSELVGDADLTALSKLEACLGGREVAASAQYGAYLQVPAAQARPFGGSGSPCGHLMATQPAAVVYGPATFLNQAVLAVNKELFAIEARDSATDKLVQERVIAAARAKGASAAAAERDGQEAAQYEEDQQLESLLSLARSTGLSDLANPPSLANTTFIASVVFASGASGPDAPKSRFAYLFPSASSALIQVRLKPDLSTAQTAQAIRWMRAAVRMRMFGLGGGGSYLVTGEPVVLNDVSASLSGQVALLLVGAVLVMGVVLVFVFRARRRLLPLALALASAAITFGLCAVAGGTLTMASIAVLPILIGLGVDYGIQFQSRASGAPTIAAAALATATGFLVLLLSPVPMVQGFGLLLVLGVGVAFLVVLSAGSAALVLGRDDVVLPAALTPLAGALRGVGALGAALSGPLAGPLSGAGRGVADLGRDAARALGRALSGAGELIWSALAPSLRGARDIVVALLARRGGSAGRNGGRSRAGVSGGGGGGDLGAGRSLAGTLARLSLRPRTVIAVGLVLAVAGWVADTQTSVQSNVEKLVPANLPALRALNTLERVTGQSGELDVVVHAANVATPAVVSWMERYESAITAHFGYTESAGCDAAATVCPALSLPDLFASSGSSAGTRLTQADITTLLDAVPAYFSSAVINAGRDYAALSFGIRLMPLSRQIRVVAYMRDHLDPPAGVSAQLAGLPVLAADADAALSSSGRRLLTLAAGLAAVALMLMAIFRRPRRALVPLVPIVLATGWSALIVWAIGIPLNPMSATLGALVIAISTEFSVLLAERFRLQRRAGEDIATALESAYRSTGRAVIASGITAIAGFAVLIASDVTMLRDFGLVTLIDMTVSLLGVLAVLPAVLSLSEGGAAVRSVVPLLRVPRRPVPA